MQELEDFMANGMTGTGEGFDAPSVGRLGGTGFGSHNPSPTELRSKIVQVSSDASHVVLMTQLKYCEHPRQSCEAGRESVMCGSA